MAFSTNKKSPNPYTDSDTVLIKNYISATDRYGPKNQNQSQNLNKNSALLTPMANRLRAKSRESRYESIEKEIMSIKETFKKARETVKGRGTLLSEDEESLREEEREDGSEMATIMVSDSRRGLSSSRRVFQAFEEEEEQEDAI